LRLRTSPRSAVPAVCRGKRAVGRQRGHLDCGCQPDATTLRRATSRPVTNASPASRRWWQRYPNARITPGDVKKINSDIPTLGGSAWTKNVGRPQGQTPIVRTPTAGNRKAPTGPVRRRDSAVPVPLVHCSGVVKSSRPGDCEANARRTGRLNAAAGRPVHWRQRPPALSTAREVQVEQRLLAWASTHLRTGLSTPRVAGTERPARKPTRSPMR